MTGKEFLLITGQDQRSEPDEWPAGKTMTLKAG